MYLSKNMIIFLMIVVGSLDIISDLSASLLMQEYNLDIGCVILLRHLMQIIIGLGIVLHQKTIKILLRNLLSPLLIFQSVLLLCGFWFGNIGISFCNIATVTLVHFTTPLLTLLFCRIFLNEAVPWRWFFYNLMMILMLGFILRIGDHDIFYHKEVLFLLFGAAIFAFMDITQRLFLNANTQQHQCIFSMITTQSLWISLMIYFLIPIPYHELYTQILNNTHCLHIILLFGISASGMIFCWLYLIRYQKFLSQMQPLSYLNFVLAIAVDCLIMHRAIKPEIKIFCVILLICLGLFIKYERYNDEVDIDSNVNFVIQK